MNSSCCPTNVSIKTKFIIVIWSLLLFVVCWIYFIQSTDGILTNQQQMELWSTTPSVLVENINIQVYEEAKNSIAILLEAERQLSETLSEKMKLLDQEISLGQDQLIKQLEKEIEILELNVTMHQDFFNYVTNVSRNMPYPGVAFYTRYTAARLGMMPLLGIEPLKPDFGPVINDVLSFQYALTIPHCQDVPKANRSVFFAIISAAGNFDKRNVTRHLWPNHLKVEQDKGLMGIAGFAFILGKPDNSQIQKRIEEESERYGDIIQIEMIDTYRNLSLKVAGLFNWLHTRNCSKVDFVFKVDDDVYVNVRNLVQFVQSRPHHDPNVTIFGNSASNLWPARGGKWGLTHEEWPWLTFPRYFYGPAVLFPGNAIVPLLASFQTTPMLHIDDLYYSGICVERAGIKISYSFNSTSVFKMKLLEYPAACDLRRFISWLTVSGKHKNNSHVATEDFYNNRTQCIVADDKAKNGTNNKTIDYTEPIQFDFLQ